jgi:hypothetical protein
VDVVEGGGGGGGEIMSKLRALKILNSYLKVIERRIFVRAKVFRAPNVADYNSPRVLQRHSKICWSVYVPVAVI